MTPTRGKICVVMVACILYVYSFLVNTISSRPSRVSAIPILVSTQFLHITVKINLVLWCDF